MRGHTAKSFLGGLATGAAVMYILDPVRGRARRARVRDKLARGVHEAENAVSAVTEDARHRVHGAMAELRGRVRHEAVPDAVLAERVRARLGHLVTHPRAIEVQACDGTVALRGDILAREVPRVVSRLRLVRGVRHLDNQLTVHAAADVPALQGAAREPSGRLVRSPMWRAVAGLAGGTILVVGAQKLLH